METETLNAIISSHIKECDGRDARNSKAFDEIKDMFKGIWNAQDTMRDSITKMQIRYSMMLGALIVLGKIFDLYLEWKR